MNSGPVAGDHRGVGKSLAGKKNLKDPERNGQASPLIPEQHRASLPWALVEGHPARGFIQEVLEISV